MSALNNTTVAVSSSSYDSLDKSQLNQFERLWVWLFENNSYPDLTIGMLFFAVMELSLIARLAMYWVFDRIPAMQKYRIQQSLGRQPPFADVVKNILFSTVVFQIPIALTFTQTLSSLNANVATVPLPSLPMVAAQILWFLVAYDFSEYWVHRALHWGPLYKYVHKVHHEAQTPYGLIAEYMHPVEFFAIGICVSLGPMIYGALAPREHALHAVTMIAWSCLAKVLSVDAHSGYDLPWGLRKFVPFFTGADWHDYHHYAFVGNYSAIFRVWDRVFGTDVGYNRHQEKLAKMRAQKAE
ncbi:hypothetical protein DFJ73DRAFT_870293 [Zopfochytrium polystomum]|nr:hypothetical protein DFJ73DRAFT_870293 [Zopfochytrium polystomum]